MDITTLELKFLLRLLGHEQYRLPVSQIQLEAKTSASERDRLCRDLRAKGLVDSEEVIQQFSITTPGKTLLGLDTRSLPLTPDERYVLEACLEGRATVASISRRVPVSERQRLMLRLAERGLIKILQVQVQDVWLTPRGSQFLRDDYRSTTTAKVISGVLLTNYLDFLRSTLGATPPFLKANPTHSLDSNITPEQVLDMIRLLDRTLQTDNYLPIFYLREKLQPPLRREALDQLLYQLERQDLIEMSTLQEVNDYRDEHLAAGIPQEVGGDLFFVSVLATL